MKLRNWFVILLMTLGMVLSMPAVALAMEYVDAEGNSHQITKFSYLDNNTVHLTRTDENDGWYVVGGEHWWVTISDRIVVDDANINLIICNGSVLFAEKGICVNSGKGLTIWEQNADNFFGKIYAGDSSSQGYAGIGGDLGCNSGDITINGGIIEAKGGYGAAGIGSGSRDAISGDSGKIIINGGTVNARGGTDRYHSSFGPGAGIGGGYSSDPGTVIINGGTVTATGGAGMRREDAQEERIYGAAGIGSGDEGRPFTITVNGGTVTATGGSDTGNESIPDEDVYIYGAAGIGGGYNCDGGATNINGGEVTASGSRWGAGIGGGGNGSGGTITIKGGTVIAHGGEWGAGIGGGEKGNGETITIKGGTVTANGGVFAAGIGGGRYDAAAGDAVAGIGGKEGSIVITGGDVTATGGIRAADIGRGGNRDLFEECDGTILINGASVKANTRGFIADMITLGYQNSDSDISVTSVSYIGRTVLKRAFKDENNTFYRSADPADNAALAGKTLTPAQNAPKPNATFTATGWDSGILTNVSDSMQYSVRGEYGWSHIWDTSVEIRAGVTTDWGIWVYLPDNSGIVGDSDVQVIEVTRAGKPEGLAKSDCTTTDNNDGKITGVTTDMEYAKYDTNSWTDVTGTEITGLAPGTYCVRVKAAGTTLASDKVKLVIAVKHKVTFMDEDGVTVLKEPTQYDHGTPAADIEKPDVPTKVTPEFTYTFKGWVPEIADVTEDAVYTASYKATTNKYAVWFVDDDGTMLKESEEYEYGTPADQIVKPADPPIRETEESFYLFNGWTPKISTVTADAKYTATYVKYPKIDITGKATINLSGTSFTYNGKVQKPTVESVTMYNESGTMETLDPSGYTVSYENENSTKVGTYTVTVTGQGSYKGTATATYGIAEKGHEHSLTKVGRVEPTCAKAGTEAYWTCSCGKMFSDAEGKNEITAPVAIPPLKHTLKKVDRVEPTCAKAGTEEYWICTECGRMFSDAEGKNEITAPVAIPALNHDLVKTDRVEPTTTSEGTEAYWTCTECGKIFSDAEGRNEIAEPQKIDKLPDDRANQKGSDGTAVGPGASAEAAEAAILAMKTDTDPDGSVFYLLQAKSVKQDKKSVTVTWKKVKGAKKYVVYGNACGKKNHMQKQAATGKNTLKVTKVRGNNGKKAKVKKGTYYKFLIVALDKDNNVISTSKLIHAATKGGKVGNPKSVKVSKKVINKAKKLKKGKSLKIGAKMVAQSKKLKVKKHTVVKYESTNKKIATVSKKGVVKARKKGSCYVYAYAQNGAAKKIKVVVK